MACSSLWFTSEANRSNLPRRRLGKFTSCKGISSPAGGINNDEAGLIDVAAQSRQQAVGVGLVHRPDEHRGTGMTRRQRLGQRQRQIAGNGRRGTAGRCGVSGPRKAPETS